MTALTEFRHAWRSIRRAPWHAGAVMAILALGIGATVAVYSIVAGVVLRPLPFPEPDRLVLVRQFDPVRGHSYMGASGPSFEDWLREAGTVTSLSAYTVPGSVILGEAEGAVRVTRSSVTDGFFPLLGASPSAGRLFGPDAARSGRRVAVLSHALWVDHFGGDADVVGRSIALEGVRFEVVGVAGEGFRYPGEVDVWTPAPHDAAYLRIRGAHILGVVGRLAPGATPASAEAELDGILAQVPGYAARTRVVPLAHALVGDVRTPLLVLLGAVGFVLLIAAANVGGLMLARSEGRRRELAIRGALGARWGRIARQVLTESLILSLGAGAAGVLLAAWLVDGLVALAPRDLPRAAEIGLDAGVLGVALAVAIATGLLTGAVPALRARRSAPGAELRKRDGRAGPRGGGKLAAAFVVAEVALSLVLLFGAGLLTRSFLTITSVDPGFMAERVTTFEYSLPPHRYGEEWRVRRFTDDLLDRVRALPLTTSAAVTRNLPLSRTDMTSPALLEGREVRDPPQVQIAQVSPDYFRTMGMPLVEGRAFAPTDGPDAPPVAIVDEAFVLAYFDGGSPLGSKARTYFGDEMREIVGVVPATAHHALTGSPPPTFYYPTAQMPAGTGRLVVRSDAPTSAVIAAVRAEVRALDPGLPLGDVAAMGQLLARSTAGPRFYAATLGAFSGLALLLALTGFFAVLSRAVANRRREMGVRLAVGASPGAVRRLVIRDGLRLTAVGLALGAAGALTTSRFLTGILYQVEPGDPVILATMMALLAGVALLAAWLPARRAAATDPVRALRAE